MTENGPGSLRVGLIVDSLDLPTYVHSFAADLARLVPGSQISALIVQKVPRTRGLARLRETAARSGWSAVFRQATYSAMLKFERVVLARAGLAAQHLTSSDASGLAQSVYEVTPQVSKSGFVYRYPEDALNDIRALDLDVLIRLGSGVLKGGILTASRHGVLSFHHGDNRINRGGPAGYWEVFLKQDSTGFIIQRLSEELDGGDIVVRGQYPTKTFFLLNQAALYRKSNIHLARVLKQLSVEGRLRFVEDNSVYSHPLYRLPKTSEQLRYLAAALGRLVGRVLWLKIMRRRYRWHVAFLRGGWKRSVLWRATTVPMENGHFVADPFVVEEQGEQYLFVEDYSVKEGKGCISAYRLDGKIAEPLGPALVEDFHLSFPFLFRCGGELFMCPETGKARQIRLYRALEFPLKWKLHRVIMDGVDAMDTMIVEHGGRWWMFTNLDAAGTGDHSSELYLFYSDHPVEGAWTPHPLNPVIIDSRSARNAGLLNDGEELFRVGQRQDFGGYGKSTSINRIVRLDPEGYEESQLCEVSPDFFRGARRTHHFHSNGKVTVFDYACFERMR